MPNKVCRESIGPGVLITLSGHVKGTELFELYQQIMSDKSFSQWRYQILDFSNADEVEVSFEQLRSFAILNSVAAQKNPNLRIAIIPRKFPRTGLDRIFHTLEKVWGAYESKTFWDVDTAREWAVSGQKSDDRDT